MLVVIWWMYGGYAWLTNVVAPDRALYQLLLLSGMAAFLVLSLSVPRAFDDTGVWFGCAYLVIVLIHTGLFTRTQRGEPGTAIFRVARWTLAAAVSIIAAGIVGGTGRWILWALAVGVILLPSFRAPPGFDIAPSHFVERHGLVVIVALGESVVAVGIGASQHSLTAGLVAVAILGLGLSACLWWTYFGEGEDERALEALAAAPRGRRGWLALNGFYHWHLFILLGIIALASGLEQAIGHADEPLSFARSLAVGGGVALFFAGDALFRRTLSIGQVRWRFAAAGLALATVALGPEIAAVAQLACLFAFVQACLILEWRARLPAEAGG